MGRPGQFDADRILDAARAVVGEGGPASLSVVGVAARLGAPSGSIYHRFRCRDTLAASLWLRIVEKFHIGCIAALGLDDPRSAARAMAAHVLTWSRDNLDDAKVLLLYRSSDLLADGWPRELRQRNREQRERLSRAVDDLCCRLGATTPDGRRRVVFAVVDLPYAAVRGPLSRGEPPPPELDAIVDDAVLAVLDGITQRRPT